MAVASGYIQITELLLKKKANPNALDGFGKTPLDWAMTRHHDNLAQLLIKYGANQK